MQCSCVCIGIQQATQPRGSSAGKSGSRVLPHSPRTGCQRPPCCALSPPTRAVLTSSPQHTLLPRLGHIPSQADLWLGGGGEEGWESRSGNKGGPWSHSV